MTMVGIAAMIMALTLVAMAVAIVPAFLEIRKTMAAARETLERIESEFKPVLGKLNDTLTDVNLLVHEASERREELSSFMGEIGDAGRKLHTINNVVGSVVGAFASSSLWLTGARAAGKFAVEKFLKKRRKSDGEQ